MARPCFVFEKGFPAIKAAHSFQFQKEFKITVDTLNTTVFGF